MLTATNVGGQGGRHNSERSSAAAITQPQKEATMYLRMRCAAVRGAVTLFSAAMASLSAPALAAAESGEVKVTPEASKLPGGAALETLTNGAAGLLRIVCLLALIVAAGLWTASHHSGNPQHASRARSGVLIAIAAALLITAAPALINFASHLGTTVK